MHGRRAIGREQGDYDIYDNESVLISGNSSAFTQMFSLRAQMITQTGQGQATTSTISSCNSTWIFLRLSIHDFE